MEAMALPITEVLKAHWFNRMYGLTKGAELMPCWVLKGMTEKRRLLNWAWAESHSGPRAARATRTAAPNRGTKTFMFSLHERRWPMHVRAAKSNRTASGAGPAAWVSVPQDAGRGCPPPPGKGTAAA